MQLLYYRSIIILSFLESKEFTVLFMKMLTIVLRHSQGSPRLQFQ